MAYETSMGLSALELTEHQAKESQEKIKSPLPLSAELTLPNRLALAPLAGTTNLAFRRLAQHYGAGLVVTELISARGLLYPGGFHRAKAYLAMDSAECLAIQIFGSQASDFRQAIPMLLEHSLYGQAAMIDLNLGCPVPKVVNGGAGAGLLRHPDEALEIMGTAVEAARPYHKPVSVKVRTAWSASDFPLEAILPKIRETGISLLTIHGRHREQFYAGEADWGRILRQADMLRGGEQETPRVYGNGDIATRQDALRAIASPAIDGLMIGRAAMGAPWIFAELLGEAPPDAKEKKEVIRMHFGALAELLGEATAAREFRSNLIAYIKGFPQARELRREASAVSDRGELERFLAKLPNF